MFERLASKLLDRFLSKYFTTAADQRQKSNNGTNDDSYNELHENGVGRGRKTGKQNDARPGRRPAGISAAQSSASAASFGVWSGFVCLENLILRTDLVNEKLRAAGHPIELVHCRIQRVELNVPWSKLSAGGTRSMHDHSDENAVILIVLDGVHVLAKMRYQFDDQALRKEAVRQRRSALAVASNSLEDITNARPAGTQPKSSYWESFKDVLKHQLQESLFWQMVDRFHIHLRNFHVRLEDIESDSSHPFACGIVLESAHVQHASHKQHDKNSTDVMNGSQEDHQELPASNFVIRKVAQLNHFGVYWNALVCDHKSNKQRLLSLEHAIMQNFQLTEEIVRALDRGIARRSTNAVAPKHAYLLAPIDMQGESTIKQYQQKSRPAIHVAISVTDVSFQIRDFQCLQFLRLRHTAKEFNYRRRYRRYRPRQKVKQDPREWWFYAFKVIEYELKEKNRKVQRRSAWERRFQRGYARRKRYCDLYERKIRSIAMINKNNGQIAPRHLQTGEEEHSGFESDSGHRHHNFKVLVTNDATLTSAEDLELQEMEDGLCDDLSIQDIILYRIVVRRRIGLDNSSLTSSLSSSRNQNDSTVIRNSWFGKKIESMVSDDVEAEQEYQKLLTCWQEWSENERSIGDATCIDSDELSALSVKLHVNMGRVELFSPLASTADQKAQHRRLQERFLEFKFADFDVGIALTGRDFDGRTVNLSLDDFVVREVRSGVRMQEQNAIISRAATNRQETDQSHVSSTTNRFAHSDPPCERERPPLLVLAIVRKPTSSTNDFVDIGIQACIHAVHVFLFPDCGWISKMSNLITYSKKIPRLKKTTEFWKDLNMAYINSWTSVRLGVLAKAETAVAEHKSIDLDIQLDCPILHVGDGAGSELVVDLGKAHLKTKKLAGVASVRLLQSATLPEDSSVVTRTSFDNSSVDNSVQRSQNERLLAKKTELESPTISARGIRQSHGSSFRFIDDDTAMGFDVEDNFASASSSSAYRTTWGAVESSFYDVYKFQIQIGSLSFHLKEALKEGAVDELCEGFQVSAELHKSIIPADQTLCRLKAYCTVDDVSISVSESRILHFGKFVENWTSVLSRNIASHAKPFNVDLRQNQIGLEGIYSGLDCPAIGEEISETDSVFDENDFFDAVETASFVSDNVSDLLDENWIADSASVADSDARSSFNKGQRRRRHQNSPSDTSSISESSLLNKRKNHFNDDAYLSADNLARLEEDVDEYSEQESAVNGGGSFHSAISPSQIEVLAGDLEKDILWLKNDINVLREEMKKEFQKQLDNANEDQTGRSIRLRLERSTAELKALQAARVDLISQIQNEANAHHFKDLREEVSVSAKRASLLIENRKQRVRGIPGALGAEHNMTRSLKRIILQLTIKLKSITFRLVGIEKYSALNSQNRSGFRENFVVHISQFAAILQHCAGESKIYLSLDHMAASLQDSSMPDVAPEYILIGGINDALSGSLMPSRFPRLISSSSMEEKFLRLAFDFRWGRCQSDLQVPFNMSKIRLVVGDIELRPATSSLILLQNAFSGLKCSLFGTTTLQKDSMKSPRNNSDFRNVHRFFDIGVRLCSLRAVLSHNSETLAAVILTETRSRIAGVLTLQPYKDRAQVDVSCNNIQVISIDNLESARASEVFGKQNMYGPLIRLKARSQKARPSDVEDWTVEQRSSGLRNSFLRTAHLGPKDDTEEIDQHFIWNSHLSIKGEPVSVIVFPRAIQRIRQSFCVLQDLVTSQPSRTPSDAIVQSRGSDAHGSGQNMRWRLDAIFKTSSVILQAVDKEEVETTTQESFVVSLGLRVSVQQSLCSREGFVFDAEINHLSLSQSSDEWSIIEPLSICVMANVALKSCLSTSMTLPPLKLAGDSSWTVTLSSNQKWDNLKRSLRGDHPLSLAVLVSPLTLNLSASAFVGLSNIAKVLLTSFNENKSASTKNRSEKVRSLLQNKDFQVELLLTAERVKLRLLREGLKRANVAPTDIIVAFSADDLAASIEKLLGSLSAEIAVGDASIIDFSCRPGVCALGGASRSVSLLDLSGNDVGIKDRPSLLDLKCAVSSVSGRFQICLDARLGHFRCLVLPSLIRSLIKFQSDIQSMRPDVDVSETKIEGPRTYYHSVLREFESVSFALRVDSFECILPSKDVPKHVRDNDNAAINAVAFRLKCELQGSICIVFLDGPGSLKKLIVDNINRQLLEDALGEYLMGRVADYQFSTAVSSELKLSVNDFQALRTSITKSSCPPYCFHVTPPVAGEQRITNSFSFSLSHQGAGVYFPPKSISGMGQDFHISQSMQLKADFVDILLYIAQSDGGLHDAFRFTVKPIIDVVKHEAKNKSRDKETQVLQHSLASPITTASSVCSIRIEGIKVTCVPGGATQLTESPILKLVLFRISIGFAAVPVPSVMKSTLEQQLSVEHLIAASWLNCEVSASYHNRRLVAWEPFIEPWMLEMRLGCDLVRAFKLKPSVEYDTNNWSPSEEPSQSLLPASLDISGGRLRDIGRLFRSPFKSKNPGDGGGSVELSRMLATDRDFCYLMLILTTEGAISSALFPPSQATDRPLYSMIPGNRPIQWLNYFGYPSGKASTVAEPPVLACLVSDSGPLNVNLTGALIDNLWGHLGKKCDGEEAFSLSPHWIRNDSGLNLRFQEVLDADRQFKGEKAPKVTLSSGTEVPLSLKRSMSQSCDPHKAYIMVELGNFEDTVDRLDQKDFNIPKGSRSSTFFYRIAGKIPVDTVGIHLYPLDWNFNMRPESRANGHSLGPRSLGWLIVRVALHGGSKIVSIESSLVIKNSSDIDIICEARDHDGLSLLWRCVVPKLARKAGVKSKESFVSVPADLAPFLHSDSYRFSVITIPHEQDIKDKSALIATENNAITRIFLPPPYSKLSFSRGIISETNISPSVYDSLVTGIAPAAESLHLNVCSIRIGSFSPEQTLRTQRPTKAPIKVPEQRMVLFRQPLIVCNHLAFPIRVQVRMKALPLALSKRLSMKIDNRGRTEDEPISSIAEPKWVDLGVIHCGQDVGWTGLGLGKVEVRVRFTGQDGGTSQQFPSWSSPVTIPSDEDMLESAEEVARFTRLPVMKVFDAKNMPLFLSVALSRGVPQVDASAYDNVRTFSSKIPVASRVVSLYTPFWIVDGTGLDLQYKSGSFVAGQVDSMLKLSEGTANPWYENNLTRGLGELLDDNDLIYLPSRMSFKVLMIGDGGSTSLRLRRRLARVQSVEGTVSQWSDPIPLTMAPGSHCDTSVMPPPTLLNGTGGETRGSADAREPFALRSCVMRAPEALGGNFGTKLVHVVYRYAIVNELGREIEVSCGPEQIVSNDFHADGREKPFHFNGPGSIRFRPKEFGWLWSGRFKVKPDRKEVTLRLRHKLKEQTIIVSVEFHSRQTSGTCVIVFRPAAHAPYRIENHSMYALQCRQIHSLLGMNSAPRSLEGALDTVILPYHHADFAWDEPDYGRHSLRLQVADLGEFPNNMNVGCFNIDRITPGTDLTLENRSFIGHVLADGPTRVLRISATSVSGSTRPQEDGELRNHGEPSLTSMTTAVTVKLLHGVGISVVDWTPQELIYVCFDNILIEQKRDGSMETFDVNVGSIVADNQLLVTPYPVALRMGNRITRRRNRRHSAVSLSCRRSLSVRSGFGDLTILKKVELSSEKPVISIDGKLADFVIGMIRHLKEIKSSGSDNAEVASRNSELRRVLNIADRDDESFQHSHENKQKSLFLGGWYSAFDYMATAGIAAKLITRYCPPSQDIVSRKSISSSWKCGTTLMSSHRHKYYIEKLRISSTTAEVSWSGSLPIASSLPRLMRPALTFEGLPLFLRPFSCSHVYGTAEEHMEALQSHYISIWRVVDLFVGILAKPTFLVRAFIFTSRESCATALATISGVLKTAENSLQNFVPNSNSTAFYGAFVGPTTRACASFLLNLSNATAAGSALIRYDAGMHHASGGLVRSRYPRLFANIDGKDVLVDYVEGENAGKSLLSRVRMGVYLGEGYVYHVEGTHLSKSGRMLPNDMDAIPLTIMITFERILLLNGQLDANFCSIVWEASLVDLVHVERCNLEGGRDWNSSAAFALVYLWYLQESSLLTREERLARALVGDDAFGLSTLHCKPIFVPLENVELLFSKMRSVNANVPGTLSSNMS